MQQTLKLRCLFSFSLVKKKVAGLAAGWLIVTGSTNQHSSYEELRAFTQTVIKLAVIVRYVFVPRVSLHVLEGFCCVLKRKCTGCSFKT